MPETSSLELSPSWQCYFHSSYVLSHIIDILIVLVQGHGKWMRRALAKRAWLSEELYQITGLLKDIEGICVFWMIRSGKGTSRCIPTLPSCVCLKIVKSLNWVDLGISHFLTTPHLPASMITFLFSACIALWNTPGFVILCLWPATSFAQRAFRAKCLPRSLCRLLLPNWRTQFIENMMQSL